MSHAGDPLYINVGAFTRDGVSMQGGGLAMDLISLVWWPLKAPFVWDEEALAQLLNEALPARGYTVESVRQHTPSAKTFFTQLPDGRWAPSPEYFSLTNGNPGTQS
jgi:hypothetical protein